MKTTMKRAGAAVLGAAALAGTFALAGATSAAADEVPKGATYHVIGSGEAMTDHVQTWVTTHIDSDDWRANVRVDYGRSGAWTVCSDGTEKHGPLQGPGYWIFAGNCYGNGTIRTYGWYDG